MGRNNTVNAINRCKCCLEEEGLKDMWKEHYSEGALEIYGDMIRDCFVMPWYPPSISESEYICESCIIRLRVAVSFKKGMLLSDQTLKEYFDRELEPKVKLEYDSENEIETEYLRVQRIEYLDNEGFVDGIKREIKIEVDESDTQVSTNKTKDKYTQDDLNKCLEAVRSQTLTQVEASTIYDIPRRIIRETLSRSETNAEYENGAPGPSTTKKLRTEDVHEKCVTTCSRQDFKPSETQSTDNESRRLSKASKKQAKTAAQRMREYRKRKKLAKKILLKQQSYQDLHAVTRTLSSQLNQTADPSTIIDGVVIERDSNQIEVDDKNLTIDHVQTPRQTLGVRLKKAPKTSAERARKFRSRQALLKQQNTQQQEPDAIAEIATEDIRSPGPSEDNPAYAPSEIGTIEKRAKSAETTRRWREKKKSFSQSSKKQAKTPAQRQREYRERKKKAKKVLLKQ